jgi:2-phospho-L-lactate guanylyltransferase
VSVLAGIPVKRFYVAKQRLSSVLSQRERSRLGRDLAARTLRAVEEAGAEPIILAADHQVARWATNNGASVLVDRRGGLDDAAAGLVAAARSEQRPWLVVHADLPLVTPDDLRLALKILATGRSPIAPADDGGTSLLGGTDSMSFSYGPASFHRHLVRLAAGQVLVRLGLSLDLDDPADLIAARSHRRGAWLGRYAVGP